jgi:hypothetical protein
LKTGKVSILISDKTNFKLVRRDKEGHLISMKGKIHQKGIKIAKAYTPNAGTLNFIK